MAIYHLSIKITSRGKGKSAVAAAAYRAGEKITNLYDGQIHDYTCKRGVIHTEIMLPNHASTAYANRSVLWNAVEQIEAAKNAQLAREVELALPVELSHVQNLSLVCGYVKQHFVDYGMCADICIHDKKDGNPHAHVLLTMRPFEHDGSWGAKSRKEYIIDAHGEKILLPSGEFKSRKVSTVDWNDQSKAEIWRQGWAEAVNHYLEQSNIATRIDHRSYERQGVDKIPTTHMGVSASQMERKGIATNRGNHNRHVEITNREMRQTRTRIKKLKSWLFSQPLTNAPTLMEVHNRISDGKKLETHWQKIADLKIRAKVLVFLQNNNIADISQVSDKVEQINKRFYDTSKKIKDIERRLDRLSKHLVHYDNLQQHKRVYRAYKNLLARKQDAFSDKHSVAIQLYENAKSHFDACMNGRKEIPIKKWRSEHKELLAERYTLCNEYYSLKDEVKNVEILQQSIENIMRENTHEHKTPPPQSIEL